MNKLGVRVATTVVTATALAAALLGGTAATASAEGSAQYPVAWTGIGIYPRAEPAMGSARASAALPDGATVTIVCETAGEAVSNGYNTTSIWERLDDGSYVPNAFVSTGVDSWTPGVPRCDPGPASPPPIAPSRVFNAEAAQEWAMANVGHELGFSADCAYFVSLAWWAGGLAQSDEWNDRDPWAWRTAGATKAAASADHFKNYVVDNNLATITEISFNDANADGAQVGDVIAYDWFWYDKQGREHVGPDGTVDHLALVITADGGPVQIAQHDPARIRQWNFTAAEQLIPTDPDYVGARAYLLHEIK